jgi:hypothetical protein
MTLLAEGDVPGGTGTEGNAGSGNGEDAVWLDLIARFDSTTPADEIPPWPDREDFAGPVRVAPTIPPTAPDGLPREPPTNPSGLPGLPVKDSPLLGEPRLGEPRLGEPRLGEPWPRLTGPGYGPRDAPRPDDPTEDHYIPPVPPPLPKLNPVTKGAWLALFSGPLYLLISTALGMAISGLAAFLAVAAFIGGFVVIVLRMDNGRPPNSGSDDDGAVV